MSCLLHSEPQTGLLPIVMLAFRTPNGFTPYCHGCVPNPNTRANRQADAPLWRFKLFIPQLLCFFCGGVLGAQANTHFGNRALFIPASFTGVVCIYVHLWQCSGWRSGGTGWVGTLAQIHIHANMIWIHTMGIYIYSIYMSKCMNARDIGSTCCLAMYIVCVQSKRCLACVSRRLAPYVTYIGVTLPQGRLALHTLSTWRASFSGASKRSSRGIRQGICSVAGRGWGEE